MRILASLALVMFIGVAPGLAQLSFTYSPSTVYSSVPVTFTDTSTAPGIVANLWHLDGLYVGGGCGCRTVTVPYTFATAGPKTVTLTLIFQNGSFTPVSQTINVQQGPLAVVQSSATTGCAPLNVSMHSAGSYSGLGPIVNYLWTFSDGGTASGPSASHTFASGAGQWFDLRVTDVAGYSNTRRTNVAAYGASVNYGINGSSTVCVSETSTIDFTITGDPPFQVTWSDALTQTITSPGQYSRQKTHTTPGAQPLQILTCTDVHGCPGIISGSAPFNVLQRPHASVSGPLRLAYGAVERLTILLSGTPPFTLTWADGVTQTTSATLATRHVIPAATTTYTLTSVMDSLGCTNGVLSPASVTVTVDPAPPLDGRAWTIDGSNTLRRVRLSDGFTLSSVALSSQGPAITAVHAFVRRPGTNSYFALVTMGSSTALVSVNVANGACTSIRTYTTALRTLTFDPLGRLIASTAPALFAFNPIYELALPGGVATQLISNAGLPTGARLAGNPVSDRLFAFGQGFIGVTKELVEIDPSTLATGPSQLFSRPGELGGTVRGFSFANGYNLLATVDAGLYVVFGESRAVIRAYSFPYTPVAIACESDAFVGLTGTNDDLTLESGIDGVFGNEGRKSIAPGQLLTMRWRCPLGSIVGVPSLLVADAYPSGSDPVLPPSGLSPIYVGYPSGIVLSAVPLNSTPANTLDFPVPPGLSGLVGRFQVVATTVTAHNGSFAASDGREIVFLP